MGKIVVFGATGTVGSALVHELSRNGTEAVAATRDPQRATHIDHEGIAVRRADLADPRTVLEVLEGASDLFLLSSASPDQVQQQNNAVRAAQRAGVERIVKLSALGTSEDSTVQLARWHHETEQLIRNSGLRWTFLHPTMFMQNLLMQAPGIQQERKFYAPMAAARLSMVDARDVGAVGAKVLLQGDTTYDEQSLVLTGPAALSFVDVAEQLSAATGERISYLDIPGDAYRQALVDSGMPGWFADDLCELYRIFREGAGEAVNPAVEEVLGRPATPFEQFARDHADHFRHLDLQAGES